MTMLSEALKYAEKGWYVFPCREKDGTPYTKNGEVLVSKTKSPYISKWEEYASVDPLQVHSWWSEWENALIGVNCEKSNLFVVDLDVKGIGKNGIDSFASFNIEHKNIALHTQTPTGGWHLVFSGTGKTTTNASSGIDTRGRGGYFIAPPSEIISGDSIGKYIAKDDWSRTPGEVPNGLFEKLFIDENKKYNYNSSGSSDGNKKQLSRRTTNFIVNGASQGERNNELFKATADFAGCGYTKEEAKESLLAVSNKIGLTRSEFEITFESAFSKPRSPSIPEEIQQKINNNDKNVSSSINNEHYPLIEDALLSALIKNNNLIPVMNDTLSYKDFLIEKNRVIYSSIINLYSMNMQVDAITVLNSHLAKSITAEDIDRLINDYDINPENIKTYALIIKEKSSIRKLKNLFANSDGVINSGKPLLELLNSFEKELVKISIDGGINSTSILDANSAMEMVAVRTKAVLNGEITLLETGFTDFDTNTGGLFPGDLMMIAGRPGEGKSALSLSIINHVGIVKKKAVLAFVLEASTHETICRLITQLSGLPFMKVFLGKLTDMEWKTKYKLANDQIRNSKIFFDDSPGITIPELRAKIRQKISEEDIRLVVIDQLEQVRGYETQSAHIQYDKISYDIKAIAKEFGIPIILNHQLNRGITDRKMKGVEPELSDLNQAGEKPVNHVWAIVHKYDEEGNIIRSKIKALKNRNGPKISFPVQFLQERMLFQNSTGGEVEFLNSDDEDDDSFDNFSTPPGWS